MLTPDENPHRRRRTSVMIAAAVVAVGLVGGLIVAAPRSDDDPASADQRAPTSTGAMIGETVTLDDGGIARVNGVRREAPVRNALYVQHEGTTSTEIEVEQCIGGDDYRPTLEWQPPEHWFDAKRWVGVLDDGTEVMARASYFLELESRPGACSRGYVTIRTPTGTEVVAVLLERLRYSRDEPLARWNLSRSRPIEAPLRPATPPDAAEMGEPETPPMLPYNITVLEITDDATPKPSGALLIEWLGYRRPRGDIGERPSVEPPGDGRKLVEIRAEVCMDPRARELGPQRGYSAPMELMWLIQSTDNYIGNGGGEGSNGWDPEGGDWPDKLSSTLIVNGDLAWDVPRRGECVEGYVQVDLPHDAVPAYALITIGDGHHREIGRIRLGE